ncbi:hypothetical protein BXP70_17545 [Hymenobacter crusticola]|uniref:Uncharacterized protein n=1 Tax=Hymenobacter crusticola TaxID=1770526 RepID=A0A243WCG5_9BACT|nr:hypothetical protein BXP70_17545 [Hymenobacter crusticola]
MAGKARRIPLLSSLIMKKYYGSLWLFLLLLLVSVVSFFSQQEPTERQDRELAQTEQSWLRQP